MLRIRMLGETRVMTEEAGATITDFNGVKPRQILEILALAAGTPVSKDRLADLLWNGRPPKSYVATLESYVCVLRKKLGLTGGRACALRTSTQGYVLEPTAVEIDLIEVRKSMRRVAGERRPEVRLAVADEAVRAVGGALLAGEDADWAREERDRFDREMVSTCTIAAADALALEEFDAAVALAHRATTHDEFAETAWQHLMRALWLSGRRCEALRAYFALRNAMQAELAVEPCPVTRALYLQILCDEPVQAAVPAAPGSPEVSALVALLRHVLETLTGLETTDDDALVRAAASALAAA